MRLPEQLRESILLGLAISCGVDRLEVFGNGLAVLVADEAERAVDHAHDAGLHGRFWEGLFDGFREALQAITADKQDVLDTARLQLVHDLQPELRAFRLLDQYP